MRNEIIERLIGAVEDREAVTAHIGEHVTAVISSGGGVWRCGLAGTQRGIGCGRSGKRSGCAAGMRVRDLACLAAGTGPEGSLGMAAINSALPVPDAREDLNAASLVAETGRGRRIAVIGRFPFSESLRDSAAVVDVFAAEADDTLGLPPERMPELLRLADVVAIAGLTLLNGALERILSLCRRDAYKVLIGPSVPVTPLLFDYGLDALSGAAVNDIPALVYAVSCGGRFRDLPGRSAVTIRKN